MLRTLILFFFHIFSLNFCFAPLHRRSVLGKYTQQRQYGTITYTYRNKKQKIKLSGICIYVYVYINKKGSLPRRVYFITKQHRHNHIYACLSLSFHLQFKSAILYKFLTLITLSSIHPSKISQLAASYINMTWSCDFRHTFHYACINVLISLTNKKFKIQDPWYA